MSEQDNRLTRIGVFYDGNYFLKVSNYYNYEHSRKARISIAGLHDFIKNQVAKQESKHVKMCHVVDTHYFRGRLNAFDAKEQNKLYHDRIFDDILMNEGVVTHYLPLKTRAGKREEKGIDVWLALEAYELSIYKKFNVVVLIACDGDYVPLLRKLNTLGIRVMVLAWDFKYIDEKTGLARETRTSQELLEEATYPVAMHEIIDNRVSKNDPLISNMFVTHDQMQSYVQAIPTTSLVNGAVGTVSSKADLVANGAVLKSTLISVKNGYGFVYSPPNNLFFSYEDVINGDFNDLKEGDVVEYTIGENDRGEYARNVRKVSVGASNGSSSYSNSNFHNSNY
ncbi:MAG: NYN domain-containing protein [Bacteroidetes bacterium]|nr:MAG: NYN domain-containing protein [Bacteroidota bacterium]